MSNIPVVQFSDMEPYVCQGCGEVRADGTPDKSKELRVFSLRVGSNNTQIITYCEACAKKVAIFFLSAWE